MILDDNIFGLEAPKVHDFIEVDSHLEFSKKLDSDPLQGEHETIIMYWNFFFVTDRVFY